MIHFLIKLFSFILISIIKAYKLLLSPLLGSNCRFAPTCSSYMIESIQTWGPLSGLWLGIKRIGRCHPWGDSGNDPVPNKESK